MTLWLVRAGRHGEREQVALQHGVALIGWHELDFDLSRVGSRDELKSEMAKVYAAKTERTINNWATQVWTFVKEIQKGDLVVLPLKVQSGIAIGRVTGGYEYRKDMPSDAHHVHPVEWLKTLPRTAFDQDLLYSFGAYMTVCQVQRNDAERRVQTILEGKKVVVAKGPQPEEMAESDIEQIAHDEIAKYISQKFKGHDLATLVEAILQAQGYKVTERSKPGPDGGVDILAGRGQFGFDSPKICVQVKSQDSALDVTALRSLKGLLQDFGADNGLLVSWGGFTGKLLDEARRSFFNIRLWDQGRLVDALLENYERVPDEVQAELPLKRIWTLVREEE